MISFSWSSDSNSVSFVPISQLLTELSWFNSVGGCSCTWGSDWGNQWVRRWHCHCHWINQRVCIWKRRQSTLSLEVVVNYGHSLGVPGHCCVGCCKRDIAVPWKDLCGVVELGLWSMLSTASVVKIPVTACDEHTAPSDSNLAHTLFATSVDIAKIWS